jgi:cation transport regulator
VTPLRFSHPFLRLLLYLASILLCMPYKTTDDLPESVRDTLPKHGQEIYQKAYNSAWEQYDEPRERREGRDREETSHAVAWSAVKNVYRKNDQGEWVKDND